MKKVVLTDHAPRPVGPYSQAIIIGSTVYCSGQIGVDPATGKLVPGGAALQARQCLLNLRSVLAAAGATMENVVKTTVFITAMADFKDVNDTYAQFFTVDPPARSTVAVAALPLGAMIEIEAVAVL